MRRAALLWLAACGRLHFDAGGDAGSPGSADARTCWGTGIVQVCPVQMPTGTMTFLSSSRGNTDTSGQCVPLAGGRGLAQNPCVVAGDTIRISTGVELAASGSRPLILLAASTITIDGTLDFSSKHATGIGAGADSTDCEPSTLPTGNAGGAGGTFGTRGGLGGKGSSGVGGQPAALMPAPTDLRGGCPGQEGAGPAPGNGGHGGGAVYLIAGISILISGTITASGESGDNGSSIGPTGGCGAGAGGMIGLDAPEVDIDGDVYANGGGGAGGATSMVGGGNGGESVSATVAAAGGMAGGTGGIGGDGSLAGGNGGNGAGSTGSASGGGGGGGGGVIKLYRTTGTSQGVISPPPS